MEVVWRGAVWVGYECQLWGYTLWRAGYACAAAGPVWGVATGALFFYDFATRALPSLDQYCTEKVSFAVQDP